MSTRSLSAFVRMIINNGSSILSPRSIAEMLKIVGDGRIPYYTQNSTSNSTDPPLLSESGLGWFWLKLNNDRRYFGHNGGLPGVSTLMLINEKKTIGVIVLSNGDILQPIDLSREVFETILNIHTKLFQCFDTDLVNSSLFRPK
jgi:CubicO group peptidase (beta-lactamase class C family)